MANRRLNVAYGHCIGQTTGQNQMNTPYNACAPHVVAQCSRIQGCPSVHAPWDFSLTQSTKSLHGFWTTTPVSEMACSSGLRHLGVPFVSW